jgi:hypothetical protein
MIPNTVGLEGIVYRSFDDPMKLKAQSRVENNLAFSRYVQTAVKWLFDSSKRKNSQAIVSTPKLVPVPHGALDVGGVN